jgi:hypothetical protein
VNAGPVASAEATGSGGPIVRVAAGAAGLVALLFAVATVNELGIGARAIADSDAAAARGDLATATSRARDAAEAAVPGSPYARGGYARLEALARGAEGRRDERGAITAWGAMRAAATATSAPLVATAAWLTLADEGIVRAGDAEGLVQSAPGEVHAPEAILRGALVREDAPSLAIFFFLGAGALAFFAGCARLAVAARDLSTLRREKIALAATAAGAILYAVACFRA